MTKGFWETVQQHTPFFCMAPMADVTDAAFRQIIAKYSKHGQSQGGPHVFWTEFVSADGLVSGGRDALMVDLIYTESERPIVAQLFGSNPEKMRQAARVIAELGFDGIDINMGCPDKSIEKQGAGASMIKTPERASEIIQAAKDGIRDAGKDIPLSVKTRVGYNNVELETWIPFILKQGIAALTVHARTRKEMSKVPANWDHIARVVALRDEIAPETLIIGNGDVVDIQDGYRKRESTRCDGIMVGRAIFGNPWLFDQTRVTIRKPKPINTFLARILPTKWMKKLRGDSRYTVLDVSTEERLHVLIEHAHLFEKLLGTVKHFSIMKKHFKAYCNGFTGAKELRTTLMEKGNSAQEVESIINEFMRKTF